MLMSLFLALLFTFVVCACLLAFWIWMLVDSLMNKRLTDTQRAIWALVIVATGFIGAIIYLLVGRSSRSSQAPAVFPQQFYQQTEEATRAYQEGYRPREAPYSSPSEYVSSVAPSENIPQWAEYEQMQISYPDEKQKPEHI